MRRHLKPPVNRVLRRQLARWALACVAGLCLQAVLLPARAQSAIPNHRLERKIKAAFLLRFLGYVEFPPHAFGDAGTPLTIGVVGADDLAAELTRMVAARADDQRAIVVRQLRETEGAEPVHLLFVGGRDLEQVGRTVRQAGGALLVVTECENGLPKGSAINFRLVDERVRFDVALDAAERNGVRLSSRLLTVANRVQKGVQ